jgi:hypothetical protein
LFPPNKQEQEQEQMYGLERGRNGVQREKLKEKTGRREKRGRQE